MVVGGHGIDLTLGIFFSFSVSCRNYARHPQAVAEVSAEGKQKKCTQEKRKVIPADNRPLLVCQKNLCFRYFCHHSCQLQVGILGVYRSPCQNNTSRIIEREMKETMQKERLKFNCKTALFHFNVFSASWSQADTSLL